MTSSKNMTHGHRSHPQYELQSCPGSHCPVEELGMSQDECDMIDNVMAAMHELVVEFQTCDGKMGDVDLIWEYDHLDVGWNDLATAQKAAAFYLAELRIVDREEPQFAKNRRE